MRELIDTAQEPGGGGELRLFRRGDDHIIVIGGNELMNSRMSGSEEALATMSCERLRSPKAAHLLIGGYGMGFTLRAVLRQIGPDADIVLAEAKVFASLAEAVADCTTIYATTVRKRGVMKPVLTPEAAAREVHASAGRSAFRWSTSR